MQSHILYDRRLHRRGTAKLASNLHSPANLSIGNAGSANGIARFCDFLLSLVVLFLGVSISTLSNYVGWVTTCPYAFAEADVSFSFTLARNISSTKRTWSV